MGKEVEITAAELLSDIEEVVTREESELWILKG
jgi:hypothetical protein